MLKRTGLILFSVFLISTSVLAEDVQITSTFDKRTVEVNEEVRLTIRISGAKGNLQAPRLPGFPGFDTFYTGRASHLTFINGKSSSTVEFSYVLVPKSVGRFTLPAIEATVEGKRYTTDPVQIEVLSSSQPSTRTQTNPYGGGTQFPSSRLPQQGGSQTPAPTEPPPAFQPSDDNVFVRAWVDKTRVFTNEQILLTYSLYTRYDTRYEGFEEEPEISGFWIEEFPMEREIRKETVRINGKRYIKADLKKVALFPQAAADYTLKPGAINVSIRQQPQQSSIFDEFFNDSFFSGGSFFARREKRILKPPPIQITALDFPQVGKPESFTGVVGNYRVTATVDKQTVMQNEPVIMRFVVEGQGNIETMNKPQIPELEGFKIYDADTSSELYKTGDVIGGRKTFEIVFVPTEAGSPTIPKLAFSFFNPGTQSYQEIFTQEFPLTVKPSNKSFKLPKALSGEETFKKKIELEGKDVRYIDESLPDLKARQIFNVVNQGLMGLGGLMTLFLLLGFLRERQARIFAKDHGLKRWRFARSTAETKIRQLKKLERSRKQEDVGRYFEEVEKILTQYLSDKFNLSAYGMTRQDLDQQLSETFGAEDKHYQEVMELYQICEESRFAKAAVPKGLKSKALKILRSTISRVERLKRK